MTLFLYILRDFFKYVFGIVILCSFLFILFDFIHKSTRYLSRFNPETKHLISFYFYQTPNLLIQALPIASLLASVITMVLLSRTNEITAMRAAGMGPLRIGAPIALGGIILTFLSVVLGELVLPYSAKKVHYIQKVLIEKTQEVQLADGVRWHREGRTLFNFKDYDTTSKILSGVRVIYIGKSFRPKRSIEANRAKFNEKTKKWTLEGVKILYFWPNGTLSYTEKRDNLPLDFPIEPNKLRKEHRLPNELSTRELDEKIVLGESAGADILHLRVDLHVKFAFHFASFVVSLIGLKFGYRSERSMETARGILMAIAFGVSYWFILNAGRALGKRGTLPPFFAAWMANFVIFAISCYSILKTRRS